MDASRLAPFLVRPGNASADEVLVRFELKADLWPGSSAYAYELSWDGSAWSADTEADPIEVFDFRGDLRGRGRDNVASGQLGARGFAVATNDGLRLEVVSMQQMAKLCSCQAKIASGTTLAIVDHVYPMDGGQSPVNEDTDELYVTAGFETDAAAYGIIAWDENADQWRPVDFPCPA